MRRQTALQVMAIGMKRAFPATHRSAFFLEHRATAYVAAADAAAQRVEALRTMCLAGGNPGGTAQGRAAAEAAAAAFAEPPDAQRARSANDWARLFRLAPAAYMAAARAARTGLWPLQEAIVAAVQQREEQEAWGGRGAMVCEATGSGKTRAVQQVILDDAASRVAAAVATPDDGADAVGAARFGQPTLVVVPKSLLLQWEHEFAKFYSPAVLSVVRVAASSTQDAGDAALDIDPERVRYCTDVVLTTYDTLKSAAAQLPAEGAAAARGLFAIAWRRIVVDEGSAVVNESTNVFAACARVRAERRIFITATPLPNSKTSELNTILSYLGCTVRVPLAADRDDGDGGNPAAIDAARRLRGSVIAHFLVRESLAHAPSGGAATPTTDWVRDLVSPEAELVWVPLLPAERRAYDAVSAGGAHPQQQQQQQYSLPELSKQLKVCASPVLLLPLAAWAALPADRPPSSKMAAVLRYERERMAPGEKALVFCEWRRPLEELGHHLTRAGVTHAMLHGDLTVRERHTLVDTFMREPDAHPRLLLVLFRVGAHGLNLQRANHVLLLTGHWSPALEAQAYGRIARPGQTRRCHFVKFVAQDTIEDYMLSVNQRKAERQRDMLSYRAADSVPDSALAAPDDKMEFC